MAFTIDPTFPPDSQSPRLGAQDIRNLTNLLLDLIGLTAGTAQTFSAPIGTATPATGAFALTAGSATADPSTALGLATMQYVDKSTKLIALTGVNTLTGTLPTSDSTYNQHLYLFSSASASTSNVTINLSGLGAQNLLFPDGSAVQAGNIIAGQQFLTYYNGSSFILLSQRLPWASYQLATSTDRNNTGSSPSSNPDPDLVINVGANQSWLLTYNIWCVSSGGNTQIQSALIPPASSTVQYNATGDSGTWNIGTNHLTTVGAANHTLLQVFAYCATTASGTIQHGIAANGTGTVKVLKGSSLQAVRLI